MTGSYDVMMARSSLLVSHNSHSAINLYLFNNACVEELYESDHVYTTNKWLSCRILDKIGCEAKLSQPYPVPKVHEKMFKKNVECLFLLRVINVANDSEWEDP